MQRVVSDYLPRIDLSLLKKAGCHPYTYFRGNFYVTEWLKGEMIINLDCEEPHLRFEYLDDLELYARMVSVDVNFGGKRWYFLCPKNKEGETCKKRVRMLYFNNGFFACRDCHHLTYESRVTHTPKHHLYRSMKYMELYWKLEKEEKKMKRKTYAGKPTKQAFKIMRIKMKMMDFDRSSFDFQEGDVLYSRRTQKTVEVPESNFDAKMQ